jgi:hypothetical protein
MSEAAYCNPSGRKVGSLMVCDILESRISEHPLQKGFCDDHLRLQSRHRTGRRPLARLLPSTRRPRGATWGTTPEEALANLETVVRMVVASLAEHGEPIMEAAPSGSVEVFAEPRIAVTV